MQLKKTITLALSELSVLRAVLGFIEAGEVSGGPLEGMKHQQTTANLKVFARLCSKVDAA